MKLGPRILIGLLAAVVTAGSASAATIGEDDRGRLRTLGPKLGLSAKEIKQAARSTGFVVCGNRAGSGALVATNQLVIATAHTFIDDKGKMADLSTCFFRNQASPSRKVPISTKPGDIIFGQQFAENHLPLDDYALVRLKRPVSGAVPYQLPSIWFMPRRGERIIMISALMQDMKKPDLSQPIVQACQVIDIIHHWQSDTLRMRAAPLLVSDCDVDHGASGSVNLVRDSDGSLVARAITTLLLTGQKDGQGESIPGEEVAAISLILFPQVIEQIEMLSGEGKLPDKPKSAGSKD